MAVRTTCVALLLAALASAGCGTVANLAQPDPGGAGPVPFGGVKRDIACLHRATGDAGSDPHSGPEPGRSPKVSLGVLSAVDLPFTLVGDLITWPYAWGYTVVNAPVPVPPVVVADAPPAAPRSQ